MSGWLGGEAQETIALLRESTVTIGPEGGTGLSTFVLVRFGGI